MTAAPDLAEFRSAISSAQAVRAWLVEAALPLWAECGVDPAGGFTECLGLDGRPNFPVPKRIVTQARQIYVYSHAHLLGLQRRAIETAWTGYQFALRHAWSPGAGWAHSLARDGSVLDSRRDLYDHAFVLFGLAWLYRATGEARVKQSIDETVEFLDRELIHPRASGYREDLSDTLPRRQNPHMHLFEAWLALFEATGDEAYLARARSMLQLFQRVFFDRSCNALREYFTDELRCPEVESSDFFEPGHHFEWVWLLHRYAQLAGESLPPECGVLHGTAQRCGFSAHHLVIDEVWMSGAPKRTSSRCWPQAEALKAALLLRADSEGRVPEAIVTRLFTHYLSGPVAGAWWDKVDEHLRPCVDRVPATTFYHLFLAFTEYLAIAESREG